MGLQSLRSKIINKLQQDAYSQSDVVYILVEIRKYFERGNKDFEENTDLKLEKAEYETVIFFRDWAVHSHKKGKTTPDKIVTLFKQVSEDSDNKIENKLFELLWSEIDTFYKKITSSEKDIECDNFFDSLRRILAEQPVTLSDERFGYKDDLNLRKW